MKTKDFIGFNEIVNLQNSIIPYIPSCGIQLWVEKKTFEAFEWATNISDSEQTIVKDSIMTQRYRVYISHACAPSFKSKGNNSGSAWN